MPPKKLYWPATRAEFDALSHAEYLKYLPLLCNLQLHQLVGINEALAVAFDLIKEAASKEDIRRGYRPPGTTIGR